MTKKNTLRDASPCARHRLLRSLLALSIASVIGSAWLSDAVAADAAVTSSSDVPTSVMGTIGNPASWRSAEFLRDWGLSAIGADYAYARGLTGQGIAVGQFDDGLFTEHPEFAGTDKFVVLQLGNPSCNTYPKVVIGGCFFSDADRPNAELTTTEGEPDSTLEYGNHGTHVAGTMVANRDGQGMHGVAFGSQLVIARFFTDTLTQKSTDVYGNTVEKTSGSPGTTTKSITEYYAKLSEHGVRVTNNEIWSPVTKATTLADIRQTYEENKPYYDAFADGAISHGIVTVNALGNDDGAIANIFPGLPQFRPDAEPYWLSVANVRRDVDGGYSIDPSSSICSYTARWCVSAPGTDIYSTVDEDAKESPGPVLHGSGTPTDPYNYDLAPHSGMAGYEDMTGTSMAAPHAAGAMALLLERYPYLTGPQVRDILLTTATPLGSPEIYGWGLINLAKAVDGPVQFLVDTVVEMDRPAGGAKTWQGDAWDDWSNDISGPGRLTKQGPGWLLLSGHNTFGGATVGEGVLELDGVNELQDALNVNGGELLLNGSLHNMQLQVAGGLGVVSATGALVNTVMDVQEGAVSFNGTQLGGSTLVGAHGFLSGTGRLASTRVDGTILPGGPGGGALTVDGNYEQTSGATFMAHLAPGGVSNPLVVTGTASLDGKLSAQYAAGSYYLGDQFSIIQAQGGVEGRFASVDGRTPSPSPFLAFVVNYNASGVDIDVARGAGLVTAAQTTNQRAVAASADSLPILQGLPRPLTQLSPSQVPAALDALSGDLYASLPMLLVESSHWVRDAALSRTRDLAALPAPGSSGVWAQLLTGNNQLRGDGNAAGIRGSDNGLLVGIDHSFEQDWRAGLMGGAGHANVSQDDTRDAKARMQNRYVGAYLGKGWGPWDVRAGLGYTRSRIDSDRNVAFPGFRDQLSVQYDASTRQAFVEGAYTVRGGQWSLEPYLQYAWVGVNSDPIREAGGAAALQGTVSNTRSNLTTLGLRYELWTAPTQKDWAHLRASVGYRYASGDLSDRAYLSWTEGTDFGVSGAPMARRSVVAELGLLFQLTPHQQLQLGYGGQFARTAQDYGANLRWSMQF